MALPAALLHALATVTFGVDHIVSGVAITILGAGVTRYLSGLTFVNIEGRGPNPVAAHRRHRTHHGPGFG